MTSQTKINYSVVSWTIGSAFLMVILNPNSDMVHVTLSCIIGFLLNKLYITKK